MSLLSSLVAPGRRPAECVLEVGGVEVTDLYPYLTEIVVHCHRTGAWTATIRFQSYRDQSGRWLVQDSSRIAAWDPVRIVAHFGAHQEEVLSGFVRQLSADHPDEQGRSTVTVDCQDSSLMLDREHVRRGWGEEPAPTTDRMILTQILARYPGLAVGPDSGAGRSGLVGVNQDGTDIDFLTQRAEANGYELVVGPRLVHFGEMRLNGQPQPPILVYAGDDTNCLTCSVTLDAHSPDAVAFDVADPDVSSSREVMVEPDNAVLGSRRVTGSGSGLRPFVWRLSQEGSADEDELRIKAQRKANELSFKVRAEGELDGTAYGHALQPGAPVTLDGVGEEFGGTYYVDTVTHRFSDAGYRQRFLIVRNALGAESPTPLSALAAVLG